MGPLETIDLNAPGGLRDYCERYAPLIWQIQQQMKPLKWNAPLIDKLIRAARRQGARAAKVCGAGGGGCVIALVEEGSRDRVHDAIRKNGGEPLDFRIATKGLTFHGAAEITDRT